MSGLSIRVDVSCLGSIVVSSDNSSKIEGMASRDFVIYDNDKLKCVETGAVVVIFFLILLNYMY